MAEEYYFDFGNNDSSNKSTSVKMTTMERARLLESQNQFPEDYLFDKLLESLSHQSAERIQSSAKQLDITTLTYLTKVLSKSIEEKKQESVEKLAEDLQRAGLNLDDLAKLSK